MKFLCCIKKKIKMFYFLKNLYKNKKTHLQNENKIIFNKNLNIKTDSNKLKLSFKLKIKN